jgi:hypothetical protein
MLIVIWKKPNLTDIRTSGEKKPANPILTGFNGILILLILAGAGDRIEESPHPLKHKHHDSDI